MKVNIKTESTQKLTSEGVTSRSEIYNSIIQQYKEYELGLSSEQEMLALLNILESHGETLDSLLTVAEDQVFCAIIMEGTDLKCRMAQKLLSVNRFFTTEEYQVVKKDRGLHGLVKQTTDGYVESQLI